MTHRDKQFRRVLTLNEARELSPEQVRWARALGYLLPMAGADGEDDGAGGGEGAGAGGGGEHAAEGGGEETETDEGGENENEESEEEEESGRGGSKDVMELSRGEYERLRRIAREFDSDKKKRERESKRQREKEQRAAGQYEDLLREKDEQIHTVEAERDEARFQLDSYKRRVRITEAAKRLGFKDPEDAFRYLSDEDTEDETTTERALKSLSKKKSYLVTERRSTGAPVNGVSATLTKADIERMSTEEINARWDEVQKAMASGL